MKGIGIMQFTDIGIDLGTASVYLGMKLCLDKGDSILVPNIAWGNYKLIVENKDDTREISITISGRHDQDYFDDDELDLGSILIDLGAGTTDIIVFVKGAPIATASIVTNRSFQVI